MDTQHISLYTDQLFSISKANVHYALLTVIYYPVH